MNRNIVISTGILISIVLGSAVYIHHRNSGSSEVPNASSAVESSDQDENLGAANYSDALVPGDPGEELQPETGSVGNETVALDYSSEAAEPSSIGHLQLAFSGEASIVEAFRNAGSEQGWGYDGLVKNLLFWEGLCSAPEPEFNKDDDLEYSRMISEKIKTFCADFPSDFTEELHDFGLVHMEETTQGVNDWSRRLNSINDLGPEAALQSAIIDLSNALYLDNYAEIADTVWFLGTSGLLEKELNVDKSTSATFSDIEVMIAVNASMFCARLGGCDGTHPVTLGLCFQFSERQCYNPGSLHHAVEQILTGRELLTFYQMHQGILSLVSRHRRGEF